MIQWIASLSSARETVNNQKTATALRSYIIYDIALSQLETPVATRNRIELV